jgi:hypothetical protein
MLAWGDVEADSHQQHPPGVLGSSDLLKRGWNPVVGVGSATGAGGDHGQCRRSFREQPQAGAWEQRNQGCGRGRDRLEAGFQCSTCRRAGKQFQILPALPIN